MPRGGGGSLCPRRYVTCSVIWGLLDKDDDLRASHELMNILKELSQIGAEI